MKLFYYTLALVLTFKITGFADEITMKELRSQFNKEIILILRSDSTISGGATEKEVERAVKKVFKKHSTLLKKEAIKLLSKIPYYDESLLKGYEKKAYIDLKKLFKQPMIKKYMGTYMAIGWNPEKVVSLTKNMILSKNMPIEKHAKRSYLSNFSEDRIYRLKDETDKQITLVMESLGDIFLTKLELSKDGFFIPISTTWMESSSR